MVYVITNSNSYINHYITLYILDEENRRIDKSERSLRVKFLQLITRRRSLVTRAKPPLIIQSDSP